MRASHTGFHISEPKISKGPNSFPQLAIRYAT